MHLVIYFCGTGENGESATSVANANAYLKNSPRVKSVFVTGCHDPNVCNSGYFPNLKAFSKRFVNTLLKKTGNDNDEAWVINNNDTDLKSVGVIPKITSAESADPIESIMLCGYSRGAVTCFEVARQLNKIAPCIPVDIVANQPVPGNCYQGPGTNASSIANCSDLNNLQNVSVILGAYTGTMYGNRTQEERCSLPLYLLKSSETLEGCTNIYVFYIDTKHLVFFDKNGHRNEVTRSDAQKSALEGYLKLTFGGDQYLTSITKSETITTIHLNPQQIKDFITLKDGCVPQETMAKRIERIMAKLIHRGFFSQIVPKLPHTINRDLIVIPCESHHQILANSSNGFAHMYMQMARYLNRRGKTLVDDKTVTKKTEEARESYKKESNFPLTLFPCGTKLQKIFGLSGKEAYQHLDKLHLAPYLRTGYTLAEQESLLGWWNKHDQKASLFSTQLTKDLVQSIKAIKDIDVQNIESLKKLFVQADIWLLLKANTSTSRYHQVEALRNNIYHLLIKQHNVERSELVMLNRQNLVETKYFLNHWTIVSKKASYFKTDATRKLDQAFAQHAENVSSKQNNDETLMAALGEWIRIKKNSKSKRLSDVIAIQKHLETVMLISTPISSKTPNLT